MSIYTLYTTEQCIFCTRAKVALRGRGLPFVEIEAPHHREEMNARVAAATGTPPTTVPQIFYGEEYVGGFTELDARLRAKQGE